MNRNWKDLPSLYGNIEGARAAFEKICGSLMRKITPHKSFEAEVKKGDDGIDIFIGSGITFDDIDVYQCKFFINDFSYAQHTQIDKSFEKILSNKKYNCKKWFLVIPRTLTIDEHTWFSEWKTQKLIKYKLNEESIVLLDGDYILDKLKEFGLYNTWFKIEDSLKIEEMHKALFKKDTEVFINSEKEIKELDNYLFNNSKFIPSEMRIDFSKILAELAQNAHQHGSADTVSVCSKNNSISIQFDGKPFDPLSFEVKPHHGWGIRSLKSFIEIYDELISCSYTLTEEKNNLVNFEFVSDLNPHQTNNPCYLFASHSIAHPSFYSDINRALDFNCEVIEINLMQTIMHFSNLSILIDQCVKRTRAYGAKFRFVLADGKLNRMMLGDLSEMQFFSKEDLSRVEWIFK